MLLRIHSLSVAYGGVRAVDGVSIDVEAGTLVGLIGPNGAGKTSLIDALSGFVAYDGGVTLDGAALDDLAPHQRVRHGLARSFQTVELFDDLDVRGNLLVATERLTVGRALRDLVAPRRPGTPGALERAVDVVGIRPLLDRSTAELSEGERKLVGVCRALVTEPRVLLLDEPAAGLDTEESRRLGDRLRAVVAAGTTVVLVDHDMDLVLGVCDVVHVIEGGRHIATGPPDEIRRDPRVAAAYLGTAVVGGAGR
ncbi:MAG TPA: ATP-binding cassette domain-containing protein [Acidimicrobiales bacterium]|nr:ATP-binding cassette domain-containing protein [Acidimicrobiales bacterium]